ncbi:MAG: FkbM family methyltransferase [Pirellulales bacterium]|nr:FkbM family methyltransferase [Pirellulales bacterium]
MKDGSGRQVASPVAKATVRQGLTRRGSPFCGGHHRANCGVELADIADHHKTEISTPRPSHFLPATLASIRPFRHDGTTPHKYRKAPRLAATRKRSAHTFFVPDRNGLPPSAPSAPSAARIPARQPYLSPMSERFRFLYRALRYRLRIDPGELRFVSQCLQPGQVAVDIGCHKGAYTYWMRRRVGPSGIVYAFEPHPCQIAYLRAAFSAMHYDNVELVPMALSDRCGSFSLHVPPGRGRSQEATLEERTTDDRGPGDENNPPLAPRPSPLPVEVTTLDEFFTGRDRGPDFLKIDVEGHELAVFRGALRTLRAYRPTILVECETRHRADRNTQPVFDLLASLDYSGSFFQGRSRRPLAEFDPALHQRLDPAKPDKLSEGYVNNFAFVPA